jgi:hypothetical protein
VFFGSIENTLDFRVFGVEGVAILVKFLGTISLSVLVLMVVEPSIGVCHVTSFWW